MDDGTVAEGHAEIWAAVRRQLGTARSQLTNPEDGELGLYEEFLDHNEFGLALDALGDVATTQRAPGDVWRSLSDAAQTMGLERNDSVHGATVERILNHMTAAQDLYGLQRMLNEWDPIGVRPELGGPDDEYSCLYAPLLGRLRSGDGAAEIGSLLRVELEGHFGLDANHAQPEAFASRLVDWFAKGAPA